MTGDSNSHALSATNIDGRVLILGDIGIWSPRNELESKVPGKALDDYYIPRPSEFIYSYVASLDLKENVVDLRIFSTPIIRRSPTKSVLVPSMWSRGILVVRKNTATVIQVIQIV